MKKRERIFLETLVLSIALILICTTMAHCTYSNVLAMSLSEKICLEQGRENQELRDWGGQYLSFTSLVPAFRSIRNTIGVNIKTSCWPIQVFPSYPKSVTAQMLFQSLPRASPLKLSFCVPERILG